LFPLGPLTGVFDDEEAASVFADEALWRAWVDGFCGIESRAGVLDLNGSGVLSAPADVDGEAGVAVVAVEPCVGEGFVEELSEVALGGGGGLPCGRDGLAEVIDGFVDIRRVAEAEFFMVTGVVFFYFQSNDCDVVAEEKVVNNRSGFSCCRLEEESKYLADWSEGGVVDYGLDNLLDFFVCQAVAAAGVAQFAQSIGVEDEAVAGAEGVLAGGEGLAGQGS